MSAGTPSRRTRWAAVIVLVAATAVLTLAPAAAASAHDYLVSSSPAAGGTVHAPVSTVSLTFDDAVLNYGRGSTALLVTGPGTATRQYETSCAHVRGRTVSATTRLGRPGRYTVAWRVVSADGHPVSDSITFTYAPTRATAAAAGSATGPACGLHGLTGAHYGATAPTTISPLLVGVLIASGIAALAVLAGIVVIVLRLTRQPVPDPAASTDVEETRTP